MNLLSQLLIGIAIAAPCAHSTEAPTPLGPILFGPEFTFATGFQGVTTARDKVIFRQTQHLVEGQPEGAKFERRGSMFFSPNGWWFNMDTNPGVIEVTTSPMDVEGFKHFKDDIQDAIFTSAANEGFFPALFTGGGHINIGTRALTANRLLIRNFIVDLFNHSELFMGILSYDTNNALPYALYPYEVKTQIANLLSKFDQENLEIYDFLIRLNTIQNNMSDGFLRAWPDTGSSRGKRTALSLVNLRSDLSYESRIEIRAVRPQASMEIWIRQIELFEKRLQYLNTIREPLPLKPQLGLLKPLIVDMDHHVLNPPIKAHQALKSFHQYLNEIGLEWADHRSYIWPAWISSGEVDLYEQSSDFKRNLKSKCELNLVSQN